MLTELTGEQTGRKCDWDGCGEPATHLFVDSSGRGRFRQERNACEPHGIEMEKSLPDAYVTSLS